VKKSSFKKSRLAIFAIILITVFLILLSFNLDYQKLIIIIREEGLKGQMVFLLYIAVSTVISPLNALILFPIALVLYGYWATVILVFIGNSIGSIINFLIARKWGRPAIVKFVGEKALKKVDVFTRAIGIKEFLIIRILGSSYSDYISYAMGVTNFPFKAYILITLPVYLVYTSVVLYLIDKAIVLRNAYSGVLILITYILPLLAGYYIWRKYKDSSN